MKLKHKLSLTFFGLTLVTSMALSALSPLMSQVASAEPSNGTIGGAFSYQYIANGTNGQPSLSIKCSGASSGSMIACPEGDRSGASVTTSYSYNAGSTYTFENPTLIGNDTILGCRASITVNDVNRPGAATYSWCGFNGGTPSTITIANPDQFQKFVGSGGAASTGGPITVNLKVDFGTTDSTLAIDPLTAKIDCAKSDTKYNKNCPMQAGGFDTKLYDYSQAAGSTTPTLTNSTITYVAQFKNSLVTKHKYTVCFTSVVLVKAVCSGDITETAKGVTITLKAKGDPTKLQTVANDGSDQSCESSAGAAGWILCLVIDGMQSLIGGMYDNIIAPLLKTDRLTTDSSSTDKTYAAWKNFRIYGNVFLIIALLIIVFGESIGGGLIDAYTAKKVLPRLLIAAILINLSFYIVAILVDVMNIVGNGLMDLITAPFGLTGSFDLDIGKGGTTTMAGLLGGALVYSAVSASGPFIPWLFFTILLPLALIMLTIVATVLLRRALIVFLVIISPVAFALYCLPNTEKYFRQWWETLFKTLLVYPIIAALFAMGKVSAYLLSNVSANVLTGGIADIMAIVALFIPLLLIPFSFKIAGGIIGRSGDLLHGGRQRLHGMGQSRRDQARQRFAATRASRSNTAWGQIDKGVDRTGIGRGAFNPIGYGVRRKMESSDQKLRNLGGDIAKSGGAQAIQHDDDALRAATYGSYLSAVKGVKAWKMQGGMVEAKAEEEAKRAAVSAQGAVGFGSPQGTWAAQQMIATGTAIRSGDHEDVASIIARVGGQNASTRAALAGNMNAQTKNAGRHDLAASFGTMDNLATAKATGAPQSTIDALSQTATVNAWNSASLYQHANDKKANVEAAIAHHSTKLTSANTGEREDAAVFFNELKAMQPSASGDVRNEIDKALNKHAVTVESVINGLGVSADSPATNKLSISRDRTGNPILDPVTLEPVVVAKRETARERVERRSRTYERVDPNNL